MRYEPIAGDHVSDAAKQLVRLANETCEPAECSFNGVTLHAQPGDSAVGVEAAYHRETERRHQEYIRTPEYKARQAEREQEEREKERALADALAASPASMTLRDADGWRQAVEANADAYGACGIRYADRWARLMEGRMAQGVPLAECASPLSFLANTEGITGFMYGCAVSVLSQVWAHGEELRRWHNLDTQVRDEGERANESGGVLNPAIISIV